MACTIYIIYKNYFFKVFRPTMFTLFTVEAFKTLASVIVDSLNTLPVPAARILLTRGLKENKYNKDSVPSIRFINNLLREV